MLFRNILQGFIAAEILFDPEKMLNGVLFNLR